MNHRYSDVLRSVFDSLTRESEWRLFFARPFKNAEKNDDEASTVDMSWKPAKTRRPALHIAKIHVATNRVLLFVSTCDGASKRMRDGILLDVRCTVDLRCTERTIFF